MHRFAFILACALFAIVKSAAAQAAPATRLVEFSFTPTKRAQIALWIESADGTFLKTVRLTSATAYRGIGNRPGALEMNSGFRWPYGRREGVLPIWAQRRANAPSASLFKRVMFQSRASEGHASQSRSDQSRDDYFCISFTHKNNELDAMSCASIFTSDKGRYLASADVGCGYAEPYEPVGQPGQGVYRALSLESLYPPRRDVKRCTTAGCYDTADVDDYTAHARAVMPDIDEVTMATPPEGEPQRVLFTVPSKWSDGDYVAWMEVHVEGDHNDCFSRTAYPTPLTPDRASDACAATPSNREAWDTWARTYGYPYRGQPSVVYRLPIHLGPSGEFKVVDPVGYSSWEPPTVDRSLLRPLDACITNDPIAAKGSGADRLLLGKNDYRLRASILDAAACALEANASGVSNFEVTTLADRKNAHHFAHLRFNTPPDSALPVYEYQVRVSTAPITDEKTFLEAQPANAATIDSEALMLSTEEPPGGLIEGDFGGLIAQTRYFVAVRPVDACNRPGPIATATVETLPVEFTTVPPCFIATAAYGSPMHPRVAALRTFRDRFLMTHSLGRAFVRAYYRVSPPLADFIRQRSWARTVVRFVLEPIVSLAEVFEGASETSQTGT